MSAKVSVFKKHPALLPLVIIVGAGFSLSWVYLFRLAAFNPDVSWFRKTNPEPWQKYDKKQYKFYAAGRDYEKTEDERPRF